MASSLGRQSPGLASCLARSLCPREPGLQTAAVVSMGSADHQFSLAEILSQNYSVRDGCAEASRCPDKCGEEPEKDSVSQSSDMPLDELLALYGYEASDPISEQESEGGDVAPNLPDMTLDKEQIAQDLLSGEEEEETQSFADDLTPSVTSHEASDLFPGQGACTCLSPSSPSAGPDAHEGYAGASCPEIMVGPQFQADLSSLHLNRHSEKIYENEDQLLWDPSVLPEREVEEFLYRAVKRRWQETAGAQLPEGETVRDSEQALYELVKCSFNVEEALRRLRFNVKVIRDGLCAWSEEECRNFEHGFRVHGKNFHLIQANKVRTRSVGECVEYYYLWKRSQRYDDFAQQTRLGRRKYVPSGTTCVHCSRGGGRVRACPPHPRGWAWWGWASPAGAGRPLPGLARSGLRRPPSSEPGPRPSQPLDDPPLCPSQLPQSGCSPRLTLRCPSRLSSCPHLQRVDLNGGPGEAVAPAQVALSVTEFGLIGIGDVNPFLAGHAARPAPGLHSEPLSHCNVMTC
uniref:MIER family member 2 n=1 Tax=Oryctolagus cuniculus TaxID=9986 RepID=A0A5F9CJT0_RABIT